MMNLFFIRPRGLNVGDDIIDFALRPRLKAAFSGDDVNIVVVPTTGADGLWISGLTADSVHEMNQYGHGVVVGSSNLYENGRIDLDRPAISRLRPPLLLCGLSHGRIYDERGRLTERTDAMPDESIVALNEHAAGSVVRDAETAERLADLGFPDVPVIGCPTLGLGRIAPDASEERHGALVSIRHPRLMNVPLAAQGRVRDEIRRIVAILRTGVDGPIRLLCHDSRDMAFAASFGDLDYVFPDDLPTYLAALGRARVVVAFRVHAFLPCLAMGTPAVNVSYDERSTSLVRTIGLEPWDINLVEVADLAGAIEDRLHRLGDLAALVEAQRARWSELDGRLTSALASFAVAVRAHADT